MRPRRSSLLLLSLFPILFPRVPLAAADAGETGPPEEAVKETPKEAPKEPPKEPPRGARPKRKAEGPRRPPARVKLPAAGEHPAEEVLALAGVLHGRVVRLESDRVRRTPILISESLAGEEVTLDELTVLLAAHKLYLFPILDPKEGKVLVVSRSPSWSLEPESFTRIIEVSPKGFEAVRAAVDRAVKARNALLPKGAAPMVAVSSARTGKIFLRASRREDIEEVARAAVQEDPAQEDAERKRDEDRPRLYTYQGKFRKVEDLEEDLLEKLEEGERNILRIVVSTRGNRLLYRCPARLGEKVKEILEGLDRAPAKEE